MRTHSIRRGTRAPRPHHGPGRLFRATALGALLALSACKAPPPVEGTIPPGSITTDLDWSAYTLGPGDVVSVTVFRHPEFSTPERGTLVDAQGNVALPLVGPVAIGDLTAPEAGLAVETALAEYLVEPSATVTVVEYGSRRVYVLGQVSTPGAYPLDRPLNALQALSLGGGFRPGADRAQVALMRTRDEDLEVHFFNASTPGVDGLVGVQPGDLLFVRMTGAGTFDEQFVPYVQGFAPILGAVTNFFVIGDALDD